MIHCTHDAVFHADDVFAGATLRLLDPLCTIKRTRDAAQLATATGLVFDVGGGAYDHHQRGGNGVRENGIPYASFGLIWRDYGAQACGGDAATAAEVDRTFVQAIDAHDNGYPLISGYTVAGVFPASIAHAVNSFNSSWDEEQDFDGGYESAVEWAIPVVRRAIARARGATQARQIVADAIAATDDPRVVVLHQYVPWQEALVEQSASALYIVYPSAGTRLAGQARGVRSRRPGRVSTARRWRR